ncbi:hypothetical protein TraAM80_04020 [Trypanosoma rangeli]|uniref:Uncharacterized protein n=1 Tax=Trypanosoma rangeli TaxID=5698 RepID=A0A3S5IRG1_TRYRA|nr:uncharacterized protein TraAM80_04020 [Trypanosoma rangeli]RNF06514.1 hypothetical protein TraAM80_04020 [Trypanosoma rangeli]|eukprot:RNF06514.1 hypothetical protein TraAM80_04020 [Trypanosoma rangeli]
MPVGSRGKGQADVALGPPPMCGMMLFVTQALAEALTLAPSACDASVSERRATQRQAEGLSPFPSEERLFKAFQQEFASCQGNPHVSMRTLSLDPAGATATVYLQRQPNPSVLERGRYLLNLDHIYTAAITFFTEAHQWWKDNTKELRIHKGTFFSVHPTLIMIVLSPTETALQMEPGSMLPLLVRASADIVDGSEKDLLVRVCGFPPGTTFSVPLERLRQIAPGSSTKSLATEGKEWSWPMARPQPRGVSCDWCDATLISSDFITHSLFFLEWCVPEDFAWPFEPTKAEGWGSDVLGKLLQGISEQLFFASGADSEPPSKRHRSEHEEAFLDMIPTARLDVGASMQAFEEAKRKVDMRFVDAIRGAVSMPSQERVVRTLLGQLNMVEEVYFAHFPHACGVSVRGATEPDSSHLPAAAPTGRVAKLLKGWKEMHKGRGGRSLLSSDLARHQTRNGGPEVEVSKEFAETPFLEMMQRRCLSAASRSSTPFLLTGDGERLLEAPCVAETTLLEPPEDMVELADVAELLTTLNASSTEHISLVTGGECGLDCQLPRGPLRDILEASVAAYIASAAVTKLSAVGAVACAHDVDESLGERDGGRFATPPKAPLKILGDVFLNVACGLDGGANSQGSPLHDALGEMMTRVGHFAANESTSTGRCCISSLNRNGESNMGGNVACRATPTALRAADAARAVVKRAAASLTEEDTNSRGVRWLRHLAFLFAHASAPIAAISSMPLAALKGLQSIEVEQSRRVVRGLEAHLFFLDAALCAVDGAIARRWANAHEALGKGTA